MSKFKRSSRNILKQYGRNLKKNESFDFDKHYSRLSKKEVKNINI